jgi:hypothetical protein
MSAHAGRANEIGCHSCDHHSHNAAHRPIVASGSPFSVQFSLPTTMLWVDSLPHLLVLILSRGEESCMGTPELHADQRSEGVLIYVTGRNVAEPGGEWNLIMTRAQALYKVAGIRTDVLAISKANRLESRSQAPNPEGVTVTHFPYRNYREMISATFQAKREARLRMTANKKSAVIISALHSEMMARGFATTGVPVVLDMHGVLDEWLEYPRRFSGNRLLLHSIVSTLKRIRRMAVRHSAAIMAVSDQLVQHASKEYGAKLAFTIPCGVLTYPQLHELKESRSVAA